MVQYKVIQSKVVDDIFYPDEWETKEYIFDTLEEAKRHCLVKLWHVFMYERKELELKDEMDLELPNKFVFLGDTLESFMTYKNARKIKLPDTMLFEPMPKNEKDLSSILLRYNQEELFSLFKHVCTEFDHLHLYSFTIKKIEDVFSFC